MDKIIKRTDGPQGARRIDILGTRFYQRVGEIECVWVLGVPIYKRIGNQISVFGVRFW